MQVELEHKLRAPLQEKRSAELTRQLAFQVNGAELTTMLRCLAQPTPCKYSTVHSGRLDLDDTPEDHIFKMVAKTWDQFVENYAVRVFDEKQRLMRLLSTLKTYLPKAAKAGWDVPTMGRLNSVAQVALAYYNVVHQRGSSHSDVLPHRWMREEVPSDRDVSSWLEEHATEAASELEIEAPSVGDLDNYGEGLKIEWSGDAVGNEEFWKKLVDRLEEDCDVFFDYTLGFYLFSNAHDEDSKWLQFFAEGHRVREDWADRSDTDVLIDGDEAAKTLVGDVRFMQDRLSMEGASYLKASFEPAMAFAPVAAKLKSWWERELELRIAPVAIHVEALAKKELPVVLVMEVVLQRDIAG